MTDKEKEELEFAHSEVANAIARFFEIQAEKRKLYKQIVELEEKCKRDVKQAGLDTAKAIFKEMYELVSDAEDYTIIVTANDIKAIAKRYGVKL